MPQLAEYVNDTRAFLSCFDGNFFFRLLHPDYNEGTQEPKRLRPRQFYGDLDASLIFLEQEVRRLNSGGTDEHRFNVYYCANDTHGISATAASISAIRLIYQDCDEPDLAAREPELASTLAHAVIESSPGKRQRIWHTEPLDPHLARPIHDHMVALHHHDASTSGAQRLLRLPGFRNWKYPDGPYARLLTLREHPRLTLEQVRAAFGFQDPATSRNGMARAAQRIQSSGDMPDHNVYNLERERAKRSPVKDADADSRARARDAHDHGPGQLRTDDVLNTLSLIDPDEHRNEWRRVLAALHYMAGDRPWGRDLAESWSMMGVVKYDPKAFEKHWNGLNDDVQFPASWLTLKRITAQTKHSKHSRALRNCQLFQNFEEEYGPILDFEQFQPEYPVHLKIETSTGISFRPDAHERRNIEYLLQMQGIEVYFDQFSNMTMACVNNVNAELDQNLIMELYSTAHATCLRVDDGFLSKQIDALALDNKRDPVKTYFSKLPVWDGISRLSTVLQRHMGAEDTPLVRELLPLLMSAIVRRTFNPGCKFDLMAILEGKQGLGKTSFFRILMPNSDWFIEGPKLTEEPKRLLSHISGKLIIEFGELAGMKTVDLGSLKKLITAQIDEYTPNYARKKVRVPRRSIFVGTVNDAQYLRDLTDNRRFPIVEVFTELDQAAFAAERDQLWAEALFEEQFYGDLRLSKEAVIDMTRIQESRLDIHSETTEIMNEIRQLRVGWMRLESLWMRIGIPHTERSKRTGHAQYLFKEVRDLMKRDGWTWNNPMRMGKELIRATYRKNTRGMVPQIVCCNGQLQHAMISKADPNSTIEDLLS